MVNYLTIVFLCIWLIAQPQAQAGAQTASPDSLKKAAADNRLPDTSRIDICRTLAGQLMQSDMPSARKYLELAMNLALKAADTMRIGTIANEKGYSYFVMGDFEDALQHYNYADSVFGRSHSPDALPARAMNKSDIANIKVNQSDYESALSIYEDALTIIKQYHGPDQQQALGILYGNIAGIFNNTRQFEKALSYDLQSLNAKRKGEAGELEICRQLLGIAGDHINLKQMPEARQYLMQADTLAEKIGSVQLFCQLYLEWGRFYRHQDDQKALESLKKSLHYAERSNSKVYRFHALRLIGFTCRDMKRYAESRDYLQEALLLSRRLGSRQNEKELLKSLAAVSANSRDYPSAAKYYGEYVAVSDSLNEEDIKEKINEIENRFQNRQKADSILVLQKNAQLQQLALHKKESQNIFIVTGSSLLLLTGLLFYRDLRNKHRLLKQAGQLREQQIATQSLMKGQEEERSRLARDLHDGVGGLLSGVKLSLSNMKGNVFLSEENAMAVNTIIGQLDSSISELRRVSHNMMPEALIKYGLKEALENYCEGIDQSGKLNVRLQTYGMEQRMEQDTEIILYRIVQELLNNVIKHADASQALVQLVRETDKFTLTVEDNGKGYDKNSPDYVKGAGLQNIAARAGYLNGVVDIRTGPGEGTSVTIEGSIS